MKREEILKTIESLAKSQGFYSRLYDCIQKYPDQAEIFLNNLEEQNFKDSVDLILYLEG